MIFVVSDRGNVSCRETAAMRYHPDDVEGRIIGRSDITNIRLVADVTFFGSIAAQPCSGAETA
jgi:hypothetical protein